MKIKKENKKNTREQILRSAIASFKLEGIHIPVNKAIDTLKKVELSLEK